MNKGERDELVVQLKLIELRQNNKHVDGIGVIKNVAFKNEYLDLPRDIILRNVINYSDSDLQLLALKCGISKSGPSFKSDSIINNTPFSIKSNKNAPPALVNHTTRPGFEFASKTFGGDMLALDSIIDEYWNLRSEGKIREDIKNSNPISPFKNNKATLKPFLNHFLFKGTGRSLSKLPAEKILGFTNPLDTNTWKTYDETNALDLYWDSLIFSLRAKKGMPKNISYHMKDSNDSVVRWTRFIDGDYRGALHIRTK